MNIKKLAETVNEYNNTYQSTIKMKPVNVKSSTYIDFGAENDDKDSKFKIFSHVKISKYNFCKRLRSIMPWISVITDLNDEKLVATFNEKELKKTNQTKFRQEKVIKRKCDILYVRWKDFDNSFNGWIDQKDMALKKSVIF